jgi:hypothetical protein
MTNTEMGLDNDTLLKYDYYLPMISRSKERVHRNNILFDPGIQNYDIAIFCVEFMCSG